MLSALEERALQVTSPPKGGRRNNQPRGTHNRNRNREDMAVGSGIHSRGKRAVPSNLGIHSPEDRSSREIPSSPDIHSSVARSPDIRRREVGRLGCGKSARPGL
jgi:hypothetical protein